MSKHPARSGTTSRKHASSSEFDRPFRWSKFSIQVTPRRRHELLADDVRRHDNGSGPFDVWSRLTKETSSSPPACWAHVVQLLEQACSERIESIDRGLNSALSAHSSMQLAATLAQDICCRSENRRGQAFELKSQNHARSWMRRFRVKDPMFACPSCTAIRKSGRPHEGLRSALSGQEVPLFNPQRDDWAEHFTWTDGRDLNVGVDMLVGRAKLRQVSARKFSGVNRMLRRIWPTNSAMFKAAFVPAGDRESHRSTAIIRRQRSISARGEA